MYLRRLLTMNSGPLADLEIVPEFTEGQLPKPLILVGRNGAGKTNLLSIIADGLVEIAAQFFSDIMPIRPNGSRTYYRLLGSTLIRTGENFELNALRFEDESDTFLVRSKSGTLDHTLLSDRMNAFPGLESWNLTGNDKSCRANAESIEKTYQSGAYIFFPSNRSEIPHWSPQFSNDPDQSKFEPRFSDRLGKSIIVSSSLSEIKPWLIDIILDSSVDLVELAQNQHNVATFINERIHHFRTLNGVNSVIRLITQEPQARVVRIGRAFRDRKIQIWRDNTPYIPSLNSLSAGQSTLLSIFCTIMRYSDRGGRDINPDGIKGVVVIDEIDAHLHADLQYEVLPKLIKLFPRIQFIVTSHSPLFPLGMQNEFGDNNYTMIELPNGTKIDAERFNEFTTSLNYFRKTKSFEIDLKNAVESLNIPTVICEGETDPLYLEAAVDIIGFNQLKGKVKFDWVGQIGPGGSQDGGKDRLQQAVKFLKNNPNFVKSKTIILFDCDTNAPQQNYNNLYVRTLKRNEFNKKCLSGIENLLPSKVFTPRFYETIEKRTADVVTVKKLKKTELCKHLCKDNPDQKNFLKFQDILEEIARIISLEEE